MEYSLYDGTIRVAQDSLNALTAILTKAKAHPDAARLPDARLHPDMLPLTFQVHFATDLAQKMAARLTGAGYAMGYGQPNLFFHVTAAYCILRKEGVPLGKMDYTSSPTLPSTCPALSFLHEREPWGS